ncbi:MAG TPA: tetratricopeptide repeat protein, partial [Roseivirga sp.]
FSEDLLEVDIYYNHMKFENSKIGKLYEEGMKSVRAKDYTKAKKYFLRANQLEPENPVILNSLGSIATEFQEYELAIDYYQQAIALSDATYTGAINNLGIVYLELEDYKKALNIFNKVLQSTDDPILQAAAWYSLTHAHLRLDSCEEAKKAFGEFRERTGTIDKYLALTEQLYLRVEACGEEILKNRKEFIEDGLTYSVSIEQMPVLNSRDSMEQASVLKLERQEAEKLVSSTNILKSDFQNDLYTEFYNNVSLTSTEILGALNRRLYLTTRLSRPDSSRYAEVQYIVQIHNGKMASPVVKSVTYSKNEEKARELSKTD